MMTSRITSKHPHIVLHHIRQREPVLENAMLLALRLRTLSMLTVGLFALMLLFMLLVFAGGIPGGRVDIDLGVIFLFIAGFYVLRALATGIELLVQAERDRLGILLADAEEKAQMGA
jgi:hypothetical protein